jgi:DsbC/DsbD-like thiol-disulfide interchange protein
MNMNFIWSISAQLLLPVVRKKCFENLSAMAYNTAAAMEHIGILTFLTCENICIPVEGSDS